MSSMHRFTASLVSVALGTLIANCSGYDSACEHSQTCGTFPRGGAAGTSGQAGDPGGSGISGKSGSGGGGSSSGGGNTGGAAEAGIGGEGGTGTVPKPCGGPCPSSTPICKEATDECVECLTSTDCKAPGKSLCDVAANGCVACLGDADCPSATASRCDAGVCKACMEKDDMSCSHIAGKQLCSAGACVQCTTKDESACGGKSCDPAPLQCTNTPVASRDLCQSCIADSECIGGNQAEPETRCVPMKFKSALRPGGFCLRRASKGCEKPYLTANSGASVSGTAVEEYCGIDQDATRCEAVVDLVNSSPCVDGKDTSCGCSRDKNGNCTKAGQGGLCRKVGLAENRCTYACGLTDQCPGGTVCPSVNYCH